jgi:hypothetical protein
MKRFALLALVLLVALLGLSGCKEDESGLLAGTWALDSTQLVAGALVLGDGSFTLSYLTSVTTFLGTIEAYSGSGTIGGTPFLIDAGYWVEMQSVTISLYQAGEDSETDSIDLDDMSYSGGDMLDGDYDGLGVYASGGKDIGSGTFIATR